MENNFIEDLQTDLLFHLPVAIYTTNPLGLLTFYNQKAETLWGRKPRLEDPGNSPFAVRGNYSRWTVPPSPVTGLRWPLH